MMYEIWKINDLREFKRTNKNSRKPTNTLREINTKADIETNHTKEYQHNTFQTKIPNRC